jgi:hypothetical protein
MRTKSPGYEDSFLNEKESIWKWGGVQLRRGMKPDADRRFEWGYVQYFKMWINQEETAKELDWLWEWIHLTKRMKLSRNGKAFTWQFEWICLKWERILLKWAGNWTENENESTEDTDSLDKLLLDVPSWKRRMNPGGNKFTCLEKRMNSADRCKLIDHLDMALKYSWKNHCIHDLSGNENESGN